MLRKQYEGKSNANDLLGSMSCAAFTTSISHPWVQAMYPAFPGKNVLEFILAHKDP